MARTPVQPNGASAIAKQSRVHVRKESSRTAVRAMRRNAICNRQKKVTLLQRATLEAELLCSSCPQTNTLTMNQRFIATTGYSSSALAVFRLDTPPLHHRHFLYEAVGPCRNYPRHPFGASLGLSGRHPLWCNAPTLGGTISVQRSRVGPSDTTCHSKANCPKVWDVPGLNAQCTHSFHVHIVRPLLPRCIWA